MTIILGSSLNANAQGFWQEEFYDAPGYYDAPEIQPRIRERTRPARIKQRKTVLPAKHEAKPQGPVIIVISIQHQSLKLYDANGLFAESPVSTGMRGHTTPMGAFSIIQKNKWHRSNIYSGAPMPYMQRMTWSGIAMHAGVLPGYPASHGCIRMPMNFATRMWNWTKMGARVVVIPGETMPADFSHPLLIARKPDPAAVSPAPAPAPAPVPAAQPDSAATPKIIVGAAGAAIQPSAPEKLNLRPSLVTQDSGAQIRTADAGDAIPQTVTDDSAKSAIMPQTVATGSVTADPAKPESSTEAATEKAPEKRTGPIAAYVSRKDGKLYVRQRFEPLFDVPVTIAGERPLGTHIFTMRADKDDPQAYRWSVISLPPHSNTEPAPKRRKTAAAPVQAPMEPASSPSEALDRITIPDEAMQRLAAAIKPGGSLIVSDQGLGQETGRGTDFIVPLR